MVSNTDLGDAGNLNITAKEINLEGGGSLNAEVNSGTQGNINLTTNNIFLRNSGEINAKATGAATGGNIFTENQDNLVLLENSQIVADAIQGNGGNINITTQGFFISPDSLISASSEFGLDGTVEIDILDERNQQAIEESNYDFISINKLISDRCFSYVGRGGTPVNPETRIDDDYNLAKVNDVNSEIVEANAISYNNRGKLAERLIISLAVTPILRRMSNKIA